MKLFKFRPIHNKSYHSQIIFILKYVKMPYSNLKKSLLEAKDKENLGKKENFP